MRIALVGDYPPPFGGVSVHVAALAQALRERGADVRVLDIGRGDHEGPGVARARGAWRLAVELARAAREKRLVHVHTNGANRKSWLLALAASRARAPGRPRALLTLHSGLAPGYLGASPGRRAMARAICARFGHVLAVSDAVAAALAGAGVPRTLLSVAPAFLAAQVVPGEPPPALRAFRASHAPLFSAALAPGVTYGEDVLTEAFRLFRGRLPRAGLVVFGRGAEARPEAPETASSARPVGAVLALGEIDHGAALAVISGSDVFVRPTRADGDALSVREALALGKLVVASAVGHRPHGCLLFRAGDAVDLARRMAEAAYLPQARQGPSLPVRDALERVLTVYRALAFGRPIPSDSAHLLQVPSWSR